MSQRFTDDTERTEHTIDSVTGDRRRGWVVNFDGATCFGIPESSPIEPRPGMVITLFGRGFGHPVRGCLLDGACVFYRTPEEEKAKCRADAQAREREQREQFDREREILDARYDALPACFRDRIDRFRSNNPDFRWRFEAYELYCCEQAVVIASVMKSAGEVRTFASMGWDEQVARCPGLDDGHSGNTFGAACRLAMDYLTDPGHVSQRHGALAPLVGSKAYGCVPSEEAKGRHGL